MMSAPICETLSGVGFLGILIGNFKGVKHNETGGPDS
jgi:hypothetical protein